MKFLSKWYTLISYVVVGAVTTIINIFTFWFFTVPVHLDYRMADTIAWVLSVLFAYVANKMFVFKNQTETKKETMCEFLYFIGFRLLSYGIDLAAMVLFISGFHMNGTIAKGLTNVVVLAVNYIFSKAFIFRNKTARENG